MNYYILDSQLTVTNSIVVANGTDPAIFGAIADERIFGIGDTWYPAPTPEEQLRADVDYLAVMTGVTL